MRSFPVASALRAVSFFPLPSSSMCIVMEKRVGAGKKSMAYALEYRAADRTLTTEEVDKQHARLIKKVCGATGAEVRG